MVIHTYTASLSLFLSLSPSHKWTLDEFHFFWIVLKKKKTIFIFPDKRSTHATNIKHTFNKIKRFNLNNNNSQFYYILWQWLFFLSWMNIIKNHKLFLFIYFSNGQYWVRRSRGEGTFYCVCVDDRQPPPKTFFDPGKTLIYCISLWNC